MSTPNSVGPMVFIVFSRGILGDYNPVKCLYIGISQRGTLVGVSPDCLPKKIRLAASLPATRTKTVDLTGSHPCYLEYLQGVNEHSRFFGTLTGSLLKNMCFKRYVSPQKVNCLVAVDPID